MTWDELINLFGRSKSGYETDNLWNEVEDKLGTSLPTDYKKFINVFGSGIICGFLRIYSPFLSSTEWDIDWIYSVIEMYKVIRENSLAFHIALFPEKAGLLPLGKTENGGLHLMWKTDGIPDQWSVVLVNDDTLEINNLDISLTEFLINIVSGKIDSNILNCIEIDYSNIFINIK